VYNKTVTVLELQATSTHIRQLDVSRDLVQTADLIELCFNSTLDADGREYLRQIRRAAADSVYMRWLPGAYERVSAPLFGYVWEEDRRIVGNLSLIPINKHGQWIYLIANVAVHPDYRRRGIAHELTLRALEHIREHHVSSAWLQVRDDNRTAIDLYLSTGFTERSRRTTWINQYNPAPLQTDEIKISERSENDWNLQRTWLTENYPPDVTWNLPFETGRFHPGFWHRILRWLNGDMQRHWAARNSLTGELLGIASWEPLRSMSDQVWIAAPPAFEDPAIRCLLPYVRQYLGSRQRSVNVNYPAGRAETAFYDAGFVPQNTLIWMEQKI
jgi:GNAT superfamily N-acetyltransferase